MNVFAMEYQIPEHLRSFNISSLLQNCMLLNNQYFQIKLTSFGFWQDGDIVNIDVTVYLNVSDIF